MGFIGANHFAEFINGEFNVFSKSTGARVGSRITDTTFWGNAGVTLDRARFGLDFEGWLRLAHADQG